MVVASPKNRCVNYLMLCWANMLWVYQGKNYGSWLVFWPVMPSQSSPVYNESQWSRAVSIRPRWRRIFTTFLSKCVALWISGGIILFDICCTITNLEYVDSLLQSLLKPLRDSGPSAISGLRIELRSSSLSAGRMYEVWGMRYNAYFQYIETI